MANVPGTFYTAETQRRGSTPVSPPNADDDPQGPIGGATVPPVAKRYTSQAIMIADQNNQISGYLYFDGTNTWWYKGTVNGDISDYVAFGSGGGGGLSGDLIIRSSNTIIFDQNYIIGSSAAPISGNILFDFTGAINGAITFVWHLDASAFTIPSQQVKLYNMTHYSTVVANLFGFMLSNATPSSEKVLVKLDRLNGF